MQYYFPAVSTHQANAAISKNLDPNMQAAPYAARHSPPMQPQLWKMMKKKSPVDLKELTANAHPLHTRIRRRDDANLADDESEGAPFKRRRRDGV